MTIEVVEGMEYDEPLTVSRDSQAFILEEKIKAYYRLKEELLNERPPERLTPLGVVSKGAFSMLVCGTTLW
ncbi:hypothetical protein [Catalinimonas alkaloidigena]|uniref:hypothetical protein n=1 Tax=Catalinimonas alkaloidigena TaxID=1075417 RepID=UPI00115FA416|nr:hypothetical protein [Catalinimonas alkaloidigena]